MIGTITAAYMASEKNASFGKAALIGIGTDFAIGLVIYGLFAVGGLALLAGGLGTAHAAGGGGSGDAEGLGGLTRGNFGALSAPAYGYKVARSIHYGMSPRARYAQLGFQGCSDCR